MTIVSERQARRGEEYTLAFTLTPISGVEFVDAWTPAAGQCTIQIDQGAPVNTANLPVGDGKYWSIVLIRDEMDGDMVVVQISNPSLFVDTAIFINTELASSMPTGKAPKWDDIATEGDVRRVGPPRPDPRGGR